MLQAVRKINEAFGDGYAFARARSVPVLCLAHVTNTMGQSEGDFEKGTAHGANNALVMLDAIVQAVRTR